MQQVINGRVKYAAGPAKDFGSGPRQNVVLEGLTQAGQPVEFRVYFDAGTQPWANLKGGSPITVAAPDPLPDRGLNADALTIQAHTQPAQGPATAGSSAPAYEPPPKKTPAEFAAIYAEGFLALREALTEFDPADGIERQLIDDEHLVSAATSVFIQTCRG